MSQYIMRAITRVMISFTILVVLVFGLYYFTDWFSKVTGYALGEDEKLLLAQCLDGKGAVLYTSATCPSCVEQLEIFGDTAAKFIEVFECNSLEEDVCGELKGVPAWNIKGEFYYGKMGFKELIKISGCDVE